MFCQYFAMFCQCFHVFFLNIFNVLSIFSMFLNSSNVMSIFSVFFNIFNVMSISQIYECFSMFSKLLTGKSMIPLRSHRKPPTLSNSSLLVLLIWIFSNILMWHSRWLKTTEGWNIPKYGLKRWFLHKVHQQATILIFLSTIWFLQ